MSIQRPESRNIRRETKESELPPYPHETVRPPAEHRDDNPRVQALLHSQTPETKQLSRRKLLGVGAGVLAGLVAGGGVLGYNILKGDDEVKASPQPTNSAPQTPGPDETSPAEPSASPEAPSSKELVALLDKVSPEKFETYPEVDRVTYAVAKSKVVPDEGYLWDFVDQKTGGKTQWGDETLSDFSPGYSPLNKMSDGREIMYQNMFMEQISYAWKEDVSESGNGPLDVETSRKLISGYMSDPTSKDYVDTVNRTERQSKAGRIDDEKVSSMIVMKTSNRRTETEGSDTAVEKIDLMINNGNNTYNETYRFIPLDDELGSGNGLWILESREQI